MNFLTELKEGLSISWAAIRANKLRSVLTTLGIIIGIVTVTLMGTAIEGLNSAFVQSISFIGADVLYVQREDWGPHSSDQWHQMQKRPDITAQQAEALARELSTARAIAPVANWMRPIKYKERSSFHFRGGLRRCAAGLCSRFNHCHEPVRTRITHRQESHHRRPPVRGHRRPR
jgi:putative ABC transport system permease protein